MQKQISIFWSCQFKRHRVHLLFLQPHLSSSIKSKRYRTFLTWFTFSICGIIFPPEENNLKKDFPYLWQASPSPYGASSISGWPPPLSSSLPPSSSPTLLEGTCLCPCLRPCLCHFSLPFCLCLFHYLCPWHSTCHSPCHCPCHCHCIFYRAYLSPPIATPAVMGTFSVNMVRIDNSINMIIMVNRNLNI